MAKHGLGSNNYELTIQIGSNNLRTETEENKILYDSLRDNLKVLAYRYIPMMKEWTDVVIKVETPVRIFTLLEKLTFLQQTALRTELLKKVIDLNNTFSTLRQKCDELNVKITPMKNPQSQGYRQVYEDEEGNEMVIIHSESSKFR